MKNLNLKKKIVKILLLILGIYLTYNYFDNKNKIANLDYGIKANVLRKSLNIPIIDGNMSATNRFGRFFGNSWTTWREKPKQNEVLHVGKNVIPSESENFILNEERDVYRKQDLSGRIMQMNIFSNIIGDSISSRNGQFFFFDSKPRNYKELNEKEVDSISKSWNLNYLIKK